MPCAMLDSFSTDGIDGLPVAGFAPSSMIEIYPAEMSLHRAANCRRDSPFSSL